MRVCRRVEYLPRHRWRGATVVRVRVGRRNLPCGPLANLVDAGFWPGASGCRALGRHVDFHGHAGDEIHGAERTAGTGEVAGAGDGAGDAGRSRWGIVDWHGSRRAAAFGGESTK